MEPVVETQNDNEFKKYHWMEELMRGSIMVVATATLTFQIAINPQGVFGNQTQSAQQGCGLPSQICKAGTSVLASSGSGYDHKLAYHLPAARERDPACISYSHCLLNYKGFLVCQAHRVSPLLWWQAWRPLALALHSHVADVFVVDIHPAARIGKGILFDHATGVVVGETAVIGNNVSILHHVTLGGTGKVGGDRHPKIGDGVLIGAGATILGNIKIGEGAKVGAGSVVLIDVPP